MAKDEDAPKEDGEAEAGEGAEGEAPKKGLSKKLLLIAGGGAALLVLLLGAGAWFFLFRAPPPKPEPPKMAGGVRLPLVPPQIVFFDMPDIVVNIQSANRRRSISSCPSPLNCRPLQKNPHCSR